MIIFLNGTSSSGKTTLLRALQNALPEPYIDAGIDRFIWMLPKRYLDRPLWDDVLGLADTAGETGHRLVLGMHRCILALATCGSSVIADHVLVEPAWVRDAATLFADLPAYLIGVRCPLDLLVERERARRDRTLGQAEKQFEKVHAHGIYDFEVDTSVNAGEECAAKIIALIESGKPPEAFRRLREIDYGSVV